MPDSLPKRLLLALLAVLILPTAALATWSIVAVNLDTGEVAVASATCLGGDLKVFVPLIRVERGAAAAQSFVNQQASNRRLMWDFFPLGVSPEAMLPLIDERDNGFQGRQFGIVDLQGRAATFTGSGAGRWRGGRTGRVGNIVYAIQGNVLTGRPVVDEAEAAFLNTNGDLSQRIMASMQAARAMGGDGRCSCNVLRPTQCGAPPANFEKSAQIAFLTLARPGDVDGVCTGALGCANGDYYLDINVKMQRAQDPDPVETLQARYDVWRADQQGRPDAVHSTAILLSSSVVAGAPAPVEIFVDLADLDGQAIGTGGAAVDFVHDPRSAGGALLDSVSDHGNGTYSVWVQPGSEPGLDVLRVIVDDGLRPVTLWPPVNLLVEPATPAPYNDARPIAGLDSSASDRHPQLMPDGLSAYVLSTRDAFPQQLLRSERPAPDAPFGPALPVAGLDHRLARVTNFAVAPNELSAVLSAVESGSTVERLYEARREDVLDPFPRPGPVAGLDSEQDSGGPFVTPDGLTLYFHSRRPGGGGGGLDLWRSRRLDPLGPWLAPEPLTGLNTPADESHPVALENGTRLIFSRVAGAGLEELCFADLTATETFADGDPLPGAVHGRRPTAAKGVWNGPDGAELWFSADTRDGTADALHARLTAQALGADAASASVAAGDSIGFALDAGPDWADAAYLIVLGGPAAAPGERVLDAVLPLTANDVTPFALLRAGRPPLQQFSGQLDADGRATALLDLATGPALDPAFVDRGYLAAFVAWRDGRAFASNAVAFELLP